MSPTPPEDDDDRTVIRPLPPTAAPAAPAQAQAPLADDETTRMMPSGSTPKPAPRPASSAHEDDGTTLPVGTRLGEFELTSVLGIGGFGIVYLAQDRSLGRRVALKEYMPSALAARKGGTQVSVKSERHRETFEAGLKSFVNEARLLAQFDHPSLVKVYRFWEANGTAYMVMPFYEGVTLKDRLKELDGPPDEAWLRGILAPLIEALDVIHAEQCYHRDIAPDNIILLAGSGRPLLLDFGAARRVIGDMTQALTVILKPGYAPLEQYAEVPNMKQGPWTDVYALAAVVYYAITGKTPPVSVGRMMGDNYVPLATSAAGRYSPRFLAAVDHALKVRPDERTPSVAALRDEMALGAGPVVDSQRTVIPPPALAVQAAPAVSASPVAAAGPGAASSRMPMFVGIGAAVLALGGVGAYLALTPGKPAPPPTVATTAPSTAPATPGMTSPAAPGTTPSSPVAGAPAAPVPAPAPAIAPSAVPVAAVPAAPFSLDGEFEQVVQGQTSGFSVSASTPKPQLRIGRDRLKFSVTSSRAGHVHVLVAGPDGSLVQVLPNSAIKALRIQAGQTLSLPPASFPLDTADPAGREDFLVIVSARPRQYTALGATVQDTFLVLPTGDRLAALATAAKGKPSILTGSPLPCDGADCWDYGAARFSVDVVK